MSLMSEQVLEQVEFSTSQFDRAVAAHDAAGDEVHFQVCGLQSKDLRRPTATKQGADALFKPNYDIALAGIPS